MRIPAILANNLRLISYAAVFALGCYAGASFVDARWDREKLTQARQEQEAKDALAKRDHELSTRYQTQRQANAKRSSDLNQKWEHANENPDPAACRLDAHRLSIVNTALVPDSAPAP
jgi:hypothetical protein